MVSLYHVIWIHYRVVRIFNWHNKNATGLYTKVVRVSEWSINVLRVGSPISTIRVSCSWHSKWKSKLMSPTGEGILVFMILTIEEDVAYGRYDLLRFFWQVTPWGRGQCQSVDNQYILINKYLYHEVGDDVYLFRKSKFEFFLLRVS